MMSHVLTTISIIINSWDLFCFMYTLPDFPHYFEIYPQNYFN